MQIVSGVSEGRIKSLLSGRLTFDAPLASSPLEYKFAFTTEFVKHWHLCVEQRLADKIIASHGPDAGDPYRGVRRTPHGDKPATTAQLVQNALGHGFDRAFDKDSVIRPFLGKPRKGLMTCLLYTSPSPRDFG